MRFELSRDQRDLQQAVRQLIETEAPHDHLVTTLDEPRRDERLWRRLVHDLGVGELLEEQSDMAVEFALVARETGRRLVCPQFLPSAVAANLLRHVDDGRTLLHDLLDGSRAVVVADHRASGDSGLVVSDADADAVTLGGTSAALLSGWADDRVALVAASSTTGAGVYLVDECSDVEVPEQQLDLTRPTATLRLDHASARRLGDLAPDAVGLTQVLQSAEAVGAAEMCLEIAVEHALTRHQFGRPIGSFQAVKHRCSTTAMRIEASRAAMWNAAWEVSVGAPTALTRSRLARTAAAETLELAAVSLIQVLGGTGFTWEHPAHLYYRRAMASQKLFGTIDEHRDVVAEQLFS